MPPRHPSDSEDPAEERLSTSEAAEVLDVRIETVRRWADSGYLRSSRFGPAGYRRFRRGDVEALKAQHDGSFPDAPAAASG